MMPLIQLELHYILTLTHPFYTFFTCRLVPLNDNKDAVTVPITDLREGELVKAGGETLKNVCLRASLCKILISSFSHKKDFADNFSVHFYK